TGTCRSGARWASSRSGASPASSCGPTSSCRSRRSRGRYGRLPPTEAVAMIGPSPLEGSALGHRLRREVGGEVRLDPLGRGRYATDASIYQVLPLGVVVPRSVADVQAVLALCREAGIPVLPRGGGTSQCGQTVGEAVVLDCSKHLRRILDVDVARRVARVQPGL